MSKNKVASKRGQSQTGLDSAEREQVRCGSIKDKVIDEQNAAIEREQGRRDNGNERFCGLCAWFYGEDTYGYGCCPFRFADLRKCDQPCEAGEHFVSKKQMRHHQAVLLQANRYRRDQHVPAIYRMPNPTELGKAIDFAGEFIKVFSNL